MLNYAVQTATAGYRLIFNSVLPSFPFAGTDRFAALCQALQAFGLNAEGIHISTLPVKLSEVILECVLLQGRALLKVTHGWMEITSNNLQGSDIHLLPVLIEAASDAVLGDWRSAMTAPVTRVTYGAHVALSVDQLQSFLAEHLSPKYESNGLRPDAFAYNVVTAGEHGNLETTRVVFARSVQLDSGVYVEFILEYGYSIPAPLVVDKAQETVWHVLEVFGFERPVPEGTTPK